MNRLPCVLLMSLAIGMTGGCASRADDPQSAPQSASRIVVAAEPVAAVADLLAMAEQAANGGKEKAEQLGAALAALDGLGARPAETGADPLPGWRASLPPKLVPPMRGRVLGPAYRRGTLEAGATLTMDQLFDGGRQARIALASPDAAPFGMAVLDGAGKAVCNPEAGSRGQCNWTPAFSGRHQIVLRNRGNERAAYYLVID